MLRKMGKYLTLVRVMRFSVITGHLSMLLVCILLCLLSRFPGFEMRFFSTALQLFIPFLGAFVSLSFSSAVWSPACRDMYLSLPLSDVFLGSGHVVFAWICFCPVMAIHLAWASRLIGIPFDPQLLILLMSQTLFYGSLSFLIMIISGSIGFSMSMGLAYLLIGILTFSDMPPWFRIYPDLLEWPRGLPVRHSILSALAWSVCFLGAGQICVRRKRRSH